MKQTETFAINYGIESNDLNNIVNIINKNNKISQVILFGSRAMGNFKPGSDIDLAIVAPDLTLDELLEIKVNIDDLLFPINVDIINFNKISNTDLLDHINRIGILISN